MRIAYVNHGRFPTEKAHGFQTAQVCDAMAELGHEVTIVCPTFRNDIAAGAQQYYGLRHPPRVVHVDHFDAFRAWYVPGKLGFMVSMRSYGRALEAYLPTQRPDLLYARSPLLLAPLLRTEIPVVLELHALPRLGKRAFVAACDRCRLVVCLTRAMRDELLSWGVGPGKLCVEGDGVDPRRFESLPDPAAAKWRWKLPADRTVVGYVGSLATRETLEKGVREIIDAAALLRDRDGGPLFWIVGGPPKWEAVYRAYARGKGLDDRHVRFQGRIDAAAVPSAIAACDLCVYPAPKTDHPYFLRDTSPLKLFEYLAAGRPTVCADLPVLRDVVDERHVRFCRPGDARDLSDAVADVLLHPDRSAERAALGRRLVEDRSWERRMRRILARATSGR